MPEGSRLIDSANCSAPGELSTDITASPRVKDPLAAPAAAGNGTCYADRGAYEREDTFGYAVSGAAGGHVPLPESVLVTQSGTASSWGEAVTYTVDFGDGGASVPAVPGKAVTHTYTTPGLYELTVTASDSSGSRHVYTQRIVAETATRPALTLTAAPATTNTPSGRVTLPDMANLALTAGAGGWELTQASVSFGNGGYTGEFTPGALTYGNESYPAPGTYKTTVTADDLLGQAAATASSLVTVGDLYAPAGPFDDYYNSKVPAHGVIQLHSTALKSHVPGYRAAYIEVSVNGDKQAGYVTVYQNGKARPADPTVTFAAGKSASGAVLAPGGAVDFYNGSGAPIALNVRTYGREATFASGSIGSGDSYFPVSPVRVLGVTKAAANGGLITFPVAGTHGVPKNASAAVLDVTATGTQAVGYVNAYPDGAANPGLHDADWVRGQTVTGLAVVPLKNGKVTLRNGSTGTTEFFADLVGYYGEYETGSVFLPTPVSRLAEVKIAGKHSVAVRVSGRDGLPSGGISAADINLVASGVTGVGSVVAYPGGTPRPGAVSLSYTPGITSSAASLTAVGADGSIDLYNYGGKTVTVFVDLVGGYYRY